MKKQRFDKKGLLIKFLKWMYYNENTEFYKEGELMIDDFLKELAKK